MIKLFSKIVDKSNNIIVVYHNIVSTNFSDCDRGNVSDTTQWGLFSNSGTLKVIDNDNSILTMLKMTKGVRVEIWLSYNSNEKLLRTFLVDSYYKDKHTKEITINLKDNLLTWQSIDFPETIYYNPTSLFYLLENIRNEHEIMFVFSSIKDYLEEIKIYCPFLRKDSFWRTIEKICEVGMLYVSEDEAGTPTISHINVKKDTVPIVIRPRNIFGISNESVVSKKSVTISVKDIVKHNNEPLAQEVPFTWYNVTGTMPLPLVSSETVYALQHNWASLSAGVGTLQLLVEVAGVSGYWGASASTFIKIPNTTFKYDDKPTISVDRKSAKKNTNGDGEVVSEKITDYTPDKSLVKKGENPNQLYVKFDVYEAKDNITTPTWIYSNGTITVKGDYFEEKEDIIFGIGEEVGGETIQLNSNELVQYGDIDGVITNSYLAQLQEAKKLTNDILCLELECSFGNYYNENDELALNEQYCECFKKHDIVTPYVMIGNIEQPYAYDIVDNKIVPKSFVIVGINYSYNGHLTQRLMLQEVAK